MGEKAAMRVLVLGGTTEASHLAHWMSENGIMVVVDATHPFASQMSHNAAEACAATGTPLLGLRRAPWVQMDGDRWIEVSTMEEAASTLGRTPRRVFLTVGRLELAPFAAAPQHRYLVRTIDPVEGALQVPHLREIRDRGPFACEAELDLLSREQVEIVVTKNSGGAATYPKIAAARALGLPVVMVARPPKPEVASVGTPEDALAWLLDHAAAPTERGV
jgi:precorrin-6A/cobalt-precorrin-6A reductase